MISKRCLICGKIKSMDDQDVCCVQCEGHELDLLITVYAFIHLHEMEYVPPNEIIENVDPVGGIGINLTFLRSWIQKEWLQKDLFNSVRVPAAIQESIEDEGFTITSCLRSILQRQKEHKPNCDPDLMQELRKELNKSPKGIHAISIQKKIQGN